MAVKDCMTEPATNRHMCLLTPQPDGPPRHLILADLGLRDESVLAVFYCGSCPLMVARGSVLPQTASPRCFYQVAE